MSTSEDVVVAGTEAADVVESLLTGRHSCRAFANRAVQADVIERMLLLAQRSPSWCNTQNWQVIVTSGAATERLRAASAAFAANNPPTPDLPFPARYTGVFQERRRECGWQLYQSVGIERGDRDASAREMSKNFSFFGAPHVAIITVERDHGFYGGVDAGVYLGCLLLAAESLGLAAVPQAAIGGIAPVIREQFDLPADRLVLCGVSFGYEAPDAAVNSFRTTRARLDEIVTWAY